MAHLYNTLFESLFWEINPWSTRLSQQKAPSSWSSHFVKLIQPSLNVATMEISIIMNIFITFHVFLKLFIKPYKTTWCKLNSLFSWICHIKWSKNTVLVFTKYSQRRAYTKKTTQRSIFYHYLAGNVALVASWEHSHNFRVPPHIIAIVLNISSSPKSWSL
jgi:hypothetical protein